MTSASFETGLSDHYSLIHIYEAEEEAQAEAEADASTV